MINPIDLTIDTAHEGLKSGEFSCVQLVEACLAVIDEHDKEINAFITVIRESALAEAAKVDEKIAQGEEIGLLEGIPYAVKDIVLTQGTKTTAGSNFLKDFIAPYDATVIVRLREAGAILIGKTNCDAYGHGASNEYSDFGPVKNPWDKSCVAGGSSGGSIASVATGMCFFALGGETGGSVRLPASMSGITGFRVSYGRVPRYGAISYASSFDIITPVARTTRDCAIVTEVIAGIDENDHTTRPDPVPCYRELLDKEEKLKIGVPKEFFPEALDDGVRKRILEGIEALKSLGHEVVEVSLPYSTDLAMATYNILTRAETSSNLERLDGVRYGTRAEDSKTMQDLWSNSRGEGFNAENKLRIMMGTYVLSAGYFDAYYKKAQKVRTLVCEDFDRVFKEVDILACPASPGVAFKIGEKAGDPVQMDLSDLFLNGFAVAGLPAVSVPAGLVEGLPIGLQLVGKYFDEETVLRIAHQFQMATDHHTKHPPLS